MSTRTALSLAVRPMAGISGPSLPGMQDRSLMRRAGLLGMALGPLVSFLALLPSSYLASTLLEALLGPDFSGTLRVPRLLVVLLFFPSVWGAGVFVVGCMRAIESSVPRYSTLVAMLLAPFLCVGSLMGLWYLGTVL